MKNYERPVVMINEELAEGVYAASGCWEITASKNDWNIIPGNPSSVYFTIKADHGGTAHISKNTTVTITFDAEVTKAEAQGFICEANGNVVTFSRSNDANADGSPDNYTINLLVYSYAADTIQATSIVYSCEKSAGVNAGMD